MCTAPNDTQPQFCLPFLENPELFGEIEGILEDGGSLRPLPEDSNS